MNAEMGCHPPAQGVRLGMLTPSSNTVLEPMTQALLVPMGPVASVHFARFRVTEIGLDDAATRQFSPEPILAAADLLADARPDVIAWNGTSASWLGFERDDALCRAVTERTGRPATSAIIGLNAALRAFDVRRLGLVTPYTADVQERIAANYRRHGIEIVSEAHCGQRDNFSFSQVSEDSIARMCRTVARAGPDAIAIVCTNMRGPLVAPVLEAELGIPIFDSVAVTLRSCLDICNVDCTPLSRFGRVFARSARMTTRRGP